MAPHDPEAGATRWEVLRRVAGPQGGFFTLEQARRCAISKQLLRHFALQGRVMRVYSRIYRLAEEPARDGRWMIPWLWSGGAGTFSHDSALELHGLRPAGGGGPVHLTVPPDWSAGRRVPPGVIMHRAEVALSERAWVQGVPVTSPARTMRDVGWAGKGGSP